ncbi:MAG: homoserine dehydrogenase [Bacteroidia bacterium]|nr:homoserine dehydrogenase [Bacteroidia bacterium]
MSKKLKIGLFGFGCVGQGLYHVLKNSTGFKADIVKIAVKDKAKLRTVEPSLITYNKWEILENPEIDVVVELIDDADEAFQIVSEALRRRKHVVTANKKMLAEHLEELYHLQYEYNVSLLYEAAACGSIPIIRSLEEYFDNEELKKVSGIFNGTTNYILTKTLTENLTYQEALCQAKDKGFAESNPVNDVEGFDPKFKAIIIALHAFGLIIKPSGVLNIGITTLQEIDIKYANEKGYKIKLTPHIHHITRDKVSVFVVPSFIKSQNHLFNVDNEFNGVIVEGKFSGEQFFQGKGAGSYPTGAAVLSDISALSHGYKYEFKKYTQNQILSFSNDVILEVYFRYNSPNDLQYLHFEEITEKYSSDSYYYVIGKIHLEHLIGYREYILTNNLFISLINERVEISNDEKLKKSFKKEFQIF